MNQHFLMKKDHVKNTTIRSLWIWHTKLLVLSRIRQGTWEDGLKSQQNGSQIVVGLHVGLQHARDKTWKILTKNRKTCSGQGYIERIGWDHCPAEGQHSLIKKCGILHSCVWYWSIDLSNLFCIFYKKWYCYWFGLIRFIYSWSVLINFSPWNKTNYNKSLFIVHLQFKKRFRLFSFKDSKRIPCH